jgi:hypothetical protein
MAKVTYDEAKDRIDGSYSAQDLLAVLVSGQNPDGSALASSTTSRTAQTTTDSYATLGAAWDVASCLRKTLVVRNTGGTNSANYRVQGSVDGTNWVEVVAEQTLAAGLSAKQHVNDYWTHLRVQIKSATATLQTTIAMEAAAFAG